MFLALSIVLTSSIPSTPTLGAPENFELVSERSGDRFGTDLDSAGDIDGDGTDDWIVGVPRAVVRGKLTGRVLVISGTDGSTLRKWLGGPMNDGLGASVAGAGDVDGDGVPDLLVGAPYAAGGNGEVRLYSGATGLALHTWSGASPGDQFGLSVAALGDVNGDGVRDVIVGAPFSDVGGNNAGEAFVYSGLDGTELQRVAGGSWDQLGRSVVGVGDVDGDGRADFAVGVPFSDAAAFNGGSVVVHSGATGALLYSSSGQTAGDQFGFALAAGEDVNGDGVGDLAVIASAADANGIDSGSATVLSGVDGSVVFVIPGPGAGLYMTAVELIADLNGDGRAEVLTGTPAAPAGTSDAGLVRVHTGVDGALVERIRGTRAWGWFGFAIAAGGDANGDGLPEFLVGAPGHDDHPKFDGYVRSLSAVAF